jgi:hypothetical protein
VGLRVRYHRTLAYRDDPAFKPPFGEPLLTHETVRIDDVVAMGVRSM